MNEQWPDYWIDRFASRDYIVWDAIRPRIWDDARVEPWYSQNAFLFVHQSAKEHYPELAAAALLQFPARVIHPELFRRFQSLEYVGGRRLCAELVTRVRRKLRWRPGNVAVPPPVEGYAQR